MKDIYLRPVPANSAPTPTRCPCHGKSADECPDARPCIECKKRTFPFETNVPGYCPACVSEPGWYELTDEPQDDNTP